MSCEYTPYTSAEVKAEIARVTQLIKDSSGTANRERFKNGNDEYESGDILKSLYDEYNFWKQQLKLACKQEGISTGKKFFTSGQYGC
jgi:hypothetical protein